MYIYIFNFDPRAMFFFYYNLNLCEFNNQNTDLVNDLLLLINIKYMNIIL